MNNRVNPAELWQQCQHSFEQQHLLNLTVISKVNKCESERTLNSLVVINWLQLVFFQSIAWFGLTFAWMYSSQWPFVFCGVVTAPWAFAVSFHAVKQLKLIYQLDFAQPVTQVQKQLSAIKIAVVISLRNSLMILPFWFVFPVFVCQMFFAFDFFTLFNTGWLVTQTLVLLFVAIWLYKIIAPKNIDKPWLNWLLQGHGSQIDTAIKLMDEINQFERED